MYRLTICGKAIAVLLVLVIVATKCGSENELAVEAAGYGRHVALEKQQMLAISLFAKPGISPCGELVAGDQALSEPASDQELRPVGEPPFWPCTLDYHAH